MILGLMRSASKPPRKTCWSGRNALLQVEQNILQSAVVAFMTVRATAETVAIRQNNIGLLEQELQAANDRFDVGEVTRTDVALAQSALAAARSDLADARADFQQAREDYRVAVGRYPGNLAPPPGLPRLEQKHRTGACLCLAQPSAASAGATCRGQCRAGHSGKTRRISSPTCL